MHEPLHVGSGQMENVRNASAASNGSKYMPKRARRTATSGLRPQIGINQGSELRITTLTILKRCNSDDFSDICWPTKIEKVFQALQSTFHILHPVPFSPPFRPLTPLVLHLCPPATTPVHPVSKLSDSSPSRPRTSGSRLVKKEERTGSIHALHCRRGLDIIYFYLHLLLRYRKRMKSRDGGEQKCLSWAFSYRNFVFTSFLVTAKQTPWAICAFPWQRTMGRWKRESFKYTGHSRLPSRRGGCQTPSPQWSVGKGGGRWEGASGWSGIDT